MEKPENERGIVKIGAGVEYQTELGIGLGFQIERYEAKRDSTNYKVNISYQF